MWPARSGWKLELLQVFPALLLSVVVVMSALRGRLYCNTLCPVGTVLGWVASRAAFRIGIDKAACTKCANCIRACKAQCIDLKAGTVDFSRCVGCQDCVSVCDERGILGEMYYKNNELDEAIQQLALAVHGGNDPDGVTVKGMPLAYDKSAEFYWFYGFALAKRNRCAEAVPVFQALLTGVPDYDLAVENATAGLDLLLVDDQVAPQAAARGPVELTHIEIAERGHSCHRCHGQRAGQGSSGRVGADGDGHAIRRRADGIA